MVNIVYTTSYLVKKEQDDLIDYLYNEMLTLQDSRTSVRFFSNSITTFHLRSPALKSIKFP